MKKTILLALLMIFSAAAARAQSLQVLSPDGGERWPLGSRRAITWNAQGVSGSVKIILRRNGVKVGDIAAGVPASGGSYDWTVGALLNGSAPAGEGYSVRIRSADNLAQDDSRAPFTLIQPAAAGPRQGLQALPADLHPAQTEPPEFHGPEPRPDLVLQEFYYQAAKKSFTLRMTNLSDVPYSGYVNIVMQTDPGGCQPQEKRAYFHSLTKGMVFLMDIFPCAVFGTPCRQHIRVELRPENPEANAQNNVFDAMVPLVNAVNFRVADAPIRLRFSHGSKTLACNFYAYNAGNTITRNDLLADYDPQSRTAAIFLDVPVVNCGGTRGNGYLGLKVTRRRGEQSETLIQRNLLPAPMALDPGQERTVSRALTLPVRPGEYYIVITGSHEPNPQCPVSFKFADEFFD
jgi:hypothetical protein